MLYIEPYNLSCKTKWNEFVSKSKNSTFLFNRDFMDYHSERFKDNSLLIFDDSGLIALFPANKRRNTIISHQGLTYGGVLVQNETKFLDYLEIFKKILEHYNYYGLKNIRIKQIPSIYNSNFNSELDYLAFLTDAKLYRKDIVSVINLNNNFDISRDRKQGYKRGVKNGLIVKETDKFDEFWTEILIPNLLSKHSVKPVHSLEEISLLKNRFTENIRQFNVYHNDKIVAGTTVFLTKNVAHVQYIGSNVEKNSLGSLDFLFHQLITDTFSKFNYFDFGTSNEDDGRKLNQGLLYWKEGYGARSLTQDFYEIDVSSFIKLDDLIIQ